MTDAVGRDAGVVSSAVAATRRRGLALCLSGGGYRATLFHLGAVRRLHELGILARVDTISSVSGGSLFAGILADIAIDRGWSRGLAVEHFDRDVAERVRMLARRDLRTGPFLAHVGWNWLLPGPRARHFERLVTKHVSRRTLSELPDRPRFVFCATDVSFGVNWESSRERTGSWRAGYLVNGAEWPIGRAVAASACFPPVFGPLPVHAPVDAFRRGRVPGQLGDRLRSRLSLSDGGVYDNMGLEPVWKDHACVLISDCGAPFEFAASRNPLRRLMRYTSVVMNQARSLRSRMFFAGITSGAHTGAYCQSIRRVRAKGIRRTSSGIASPRFGPTSTRSPMPNSESSRTTATGSLTRVCAPACPTYRRQTPRLPARQARSGWIHAELAKHCAGATGGSHRIGYSPADDRINR